MKIEMTVRIDEIGYLDETGSPGVKFCHDGGESFYVTLLKEQVQEVGKANLLFRPVKMTIILEES